MGIPVSKCSSLRKIQNLNEHNLQKIFTDPAKGSLAYAKLQQHLNNYGSSIYQHSHRHVGDEEWKKVAPKLAGENPQLFLEKSESIFFNNDKFLWGVIDPFQQAFGRVFCTYRDLIHKNDLIEKYPPNISSGLKFLSQVEFINKHGEPPWDFVNQILEICQLDFRIEPPPMHEVSSYEPKLLKVSSDVDMRFQDLSSGEKVLMSFALCLYNAHDTRQEKAFPKLLLLDEVDAPLHPSMVKSLLRTIQEVLVDGKGISVILTTHSPSTVALAPELSLYEMNSYNSSVVKVSRSNAISILTAGVPTLSVSFDGRRQVFVESRTDAYIYEKIYQLYKSYFQSDRSLIFIEVGNTDRSGGEHNSGCDQVKRLVSNLSKAGNTSVFGLIDWDGKNKSANRVHILSHEIRNGLESLLFDPILLAATVIKNNIIFCKKIGLIDAEDSYVDIGNWEQEKWQKVSNIIQNIIIDDYSATNDMLEIKYLNNMTIIVSKNYLHLDDHQLEYNIMKEFGFLKPKNNKAGGLMQHIISSILPDYQNLISQDILDTFKGILEADS